jgi:hypothetical protein
MSEYPKWRHHPEMESVIVYDEGQEESQAPSSEEWRDDRDFPEYLDEQDGSQGEDAPKRKPGRPRKVSE